MVEDNVENDPSLERIYKMFPVFGKQEDEQNQRQGFGEVSSVGRESPRVGRVPYTTHQKFKKLKPRQQPRKNVNCLYNKTRVTLRLSDLMTWMKEKRINFTLYNRIYISIEIKI